MRIDEQTTERVVDFHGHMCPGLAMGIRAAEVALAEIGPHSADEEVVAVVETDMCGVDAIQFLTGCTFGKGNLIHLDYGKNAYTFIRRSDGRAVRVSTRPGAFGDDPERAELREAISSGAATDAQRKRFGELQQARSVDLLEAPIERLYEIREVDAEVPPRARVFTSIPCDACGEPTMRPRIREVEAASCARRARSKRPHHRAPSFGGPEGGVLEPEAPSSGAGALRGQGTTGFALLYLGSFLVYGDRFAIPPMLVAISEDLDEPLGAVTVVATVYFLLYGLTQFPYGSPPTGSAGCG